MIRWSTVFLDVPAAGVDAASSFWCSALEATLSPWRAGGRFATVQPRIGDATVRIQRVDDGPGGVHLDLHVDEPLAVAAARAVELGAEIVAEQDRVVVLRSPGGFAFCVVPWNGETERGPGRLDQLCLDVPPSAHERELAFWPALLEAPTVVAGPEFQRILPGPGRPLRLLFQRLDSGEGPVSGHVDLAAGPARDVVVARHEELGARVVSVHEDWTVMRDPAGRVYCLTARTPG